MNHTAEIVLHASKAETTTGQTTGFNVKGFSEAQLLIDITAVSGTTPTINFYVDTYDFLSGKWFPLSVTIAQQTAVADVLTQLTEFGEQIRLRWTIGGTTPSFTFSASLVAKTSSSL